jgi:maltose alpha-D-glucosyltransferase/alpha-amylase
LLIEVQYESGLPESYQVPVTFAAEIHAQGLKTGSPQGIIADLKVGSENGLLVDALFLPEFQHALFNKLAGGESINVGKSLIEFRANQQLHHPINAPAEIKSRINSDDGFTSIIYENGFFLKMYRKIDPTTNPDLEITRYLSETVKFEHVPVYCGSIEWKFPKDTIALGMLQVLIENHGDGYGFMLSSVDNYIESVLSAKKETLDSLPSLGSITDPVEYEDLPDELQILLGANASEQARKIGIRTAEMHLALASGSNLKDFSPEEFTLHYQRSLYSSMQSLVRSTFQNKSIDHVPENVQEELKDFLERKPDVLNKFKRIYEKKLDVLKIRIHGNLHLGQVLLTGKDVVINDFGGNPERTFSERRLKRSPLRDVASMIGSLRYVAYEGFLKTTHLVDGNIDQLLPYGKLWAHYMVGFFLKAYLDTIEGSSFIPADKKELKLMLDTYLLEKAIIDLNYERKNNPAQMEVTLKIIKSIIG